MQNRRESIEANIEPQRKYRDQYRTVEKVQRTIQNCRESIENNIEPSRKYRDQYKKKKILNVIST